MQLADLGADVIKIEDPVVGGDVGRYIPPYQEGDSSLFFEAFNRGKRSVSLDLRHPAARHVLEDLVRASDALFSNLRGDGPTKLGLRHDDLRDVNPQIVCCSLSGFGMTGPRATEGAYDYTLQGLAGWQAITGEPEAPPTKSGLSLVDFCGGYVAALALLGAVWQARRDGIGGDVDLSLHEVALAQLTYIGTWVASRGYTPVRRAMSAHQTIVPFQNFETADGWLVVACPKQALWERLCGAIGRQDLLDDPSYTTFADRDEHREELLAILGEAFHARPTADWLDVLADAGVPCAPVHDVSEALADRQVAARHALAEYDHPVLGRVRQVASPLRVQGRPGDDRRGPQRGEHTADVLRDVCSYDNETLMRLAEDGVFGDVAVGERTTT
jgi:crotonobetainyl-CoA:carnitine CoA-transferase CaiB-like acyl-CoA transferase